MWLQHVCYKAGSAFGGIGGASHSATFSSALGKSAPQALHCVSAECEVRNLVERAKGERVWSVEGCNAYIAKQKCSQS